MRAHAAVRMSVEEVALAHALARRRGHHQVVHERALAQRAQEFQQALDERREAHGLGARRGVEHALLKNLYLLIASTLLATSRMMQLRAWSWRSTRRAK